MDCIAGVIFSGIRSGYKLSLLPSQYDEPLRSARSWIRKFVPWVFCVVGLVGSFMVWQMIKDYENHLVEQEFQGEAELLSTAIVKETQEYVRQLNSLRAFYSASSHIHFDEFHIYAEANIDDYTGIHALAWAPQIGHEARVAHEVYQRRINPNQGSIYEFNAKRSPIPAHERAYYYPITYIAPYEINASDVGLDLGSNAVQRKAMGHAISSGEIALTERMSFLHTPPNNSVVIAFLPIFKERVERGRDETRSEEDVLGFMVSLWNIGEILENAIAELSTEEIDISLHDCVETGETEFLYGHTSRESKYSVRGGRTAIHRLKGHLSTTVHIEIGGRRWVTICSPTEAYIAARESWTASAGLGTGLLFTFILTLNLNNLIRRSDRIEQVVWERTVTLRDLNQKLIDAKEMADMGSVAKSEFLATMSHELRTPLNGVIGMTELLQGTGLDEHQEQYVKTCASSAKSLLSLINDILDFSKIESGALELDEHAFRFETVVGETMGTMSHHAHSKGVELLGYIDPLLKHTFVGDSDKFNQVVLNLLNNAIKFTESGHVIFRAVYERECDGRVEVRCSVTDTGIGIPSRQMHRLFKSFSQTDRSTTRKYGGTGLGLAISKRLVEAMGGEMGVESTKDIGSIFWFTIRFGVPEAVEVDEVGDAVADGAVLALFSENHVSRSVMDMQLRDAGYEVEGFDLSVMPDKVLSEGGHFDFVVIDIPAGKRSMEGIDELVELAWDYGDQVVLLVPVDFQYECQGNGRLNGLSMVSKPLNVDAFNKAVAGVGAGERSDGEGVPGEAETGDVSRGVLNEGDEGMSEDVKCRILVAEDNETNCMYISEVLRRLGYSFKVVGNGVEAVEAVGREVYSLVLMDCQMPEMDGYDATRLIREQEKERGVGRIPIVALTANAIKRELEKCIEMGMDSYLTKPVEIDHLSEVLEKYLDRSCDESSEDDVERGAGIAAMGEGDDAEVVDEGMEVPINIETAYGRCMNDIEFLKSTFESFVTLSPGYVKELREYLEQGDGESVSRTAHSIKGAASMITANELQRVAALIEKTSREGELDQLGDAIVALQKELDTCISYIRRHEGDLLSQIKLTQELK